MDFQNPIRLFNISGKTAVVTGGAGVICSDICRMLAAIGVKVAILDINCRVTENLCAEIEAAGGEAVSVNCDIMDKASLEIAAQQVLAAYQQVDIFVNGTGGNKPQATTSLQNSFFDLPVDALRWVLDFCKPSWEPYYLVRYSVNSWRSREVE